MNLRETLSLFVLPGDPVELRFLGVERPGRTYAGWLTLAEADRCESAALHLSNLSAGVYFTPHVLHSDVLSRGKTGHFGPCRKRGGDTMPRLTHDEDVTHRRYLLIDVDSVRPGHECESANDGERAAAAAVADHVTTELRAVGVWADPLRVDSGNGVHLYYRLPERLGGGPVDAASDPIASLLRHIAAVCDTPGASVDGRVYNSGRIMKLPGSWSKKGRSTVERPHRRSEIVSIPEGWAAS